MSTHKFSRRSFLGGLSASLACVGLAQEKEDTYRGYKLYWTGWKTIAQQIELCAQWLAIPSDEKKESLYSASTGALGTYRDCETLNIAHYSPMPLIRSTSTWEQREQSKALARDRLIKLIDAQEEDRLNEYINDTLYPMHEDNKRLRYVWKEFK